MIRGRPGAEPAAVAKAGVEALQHLGVELADRALAERRLDIAADEALVALARRVLQLGDLQPLVEHLVDRDGAARVPSLVDLRQEFDQPTCVRARVSAAFFRHRGLPVRGVGTGLHDSAEATLDPLGSLLDRATAPPGCAGRGPKRRRSSSPIYTPRGDGGSGCCYLPVQRGCPRQDSNLRHTV